jgi:hypothetical protein
MVKNLAQQGAINLSGVRPQLSEVMSDSEIVKRAQGQTTDSDESEDENMELIPQTRISNSSALQWTKGLLEFLEQQRLCKTKLRHQLICSSGRKERRILVWLKLHCISVYK